MNKKINVILLAVFCLWEATTYAGSSPCHSEYGNMHCEKGEVENIHYLGNVVLKKMKINHLLAVTGNLEVFSSEIGLADTMGQLEGDGLTINETLTHTGDVKTRNSLFKGKVKVLGEYTSYGSQYFQSIEVTGKSNFKENKFYDQIRLRGKLFSLKNSFHKNIMARSCEIHLNNSYTRNINIDKEKNCKENIQKIYLAQKTIVEGDIVFNGNEGRVYKDASSTINGRVINGAVSNS